MMMTGKTSGSEVAVTSNTAGAGGGSFFWVSGHPFKLAQTVYLEVHG